jgi:paraquat-inducible protein A
VTIACPDCGALEDIPVLPPKSTAVCVRCEGDLEKTAGRSVNAALACSLATLLLLFPSNLLPLVSIDVFGFHAQSTIAIGVWRLFQHQWVLLAGLTALFVIVLPFLRFGLLTAVLGACGWGFGRGGSARRSDGRYGWTSGRCSMCSCWLPALDTTA